MRDENYYKILIEGGVLPATDVTELEEEEIKDDEIRVQYDDPNYEGAYKIQKLDCDYTDAEIANLIGMKKLKSINVIKTIMIVYVILTVISIIFSIIGIASI